MSGCVVETERLYIKLMEPQDTTLANFYEDLHPELLVLDPPIGKCISPMLLSVFLKKTNAHFGMCSLYNLDPTGESIELGVRIFIPEYWEQGYGKEIVEGLCFYVMSVYPTVTSVFAKTPIHNMRAIRCYEKCGFSEHSRGFVDGYEMVFMVKRKG